MRILVLKFPFCFWVSVKLWASCPEYELVSLVTPFPVAVILPAPGAYTLNFRVFLLMLLDSTEMPVGQPVTSMWVSWLISAPFWRDEFCRHREFALAEVAVRCQGGVLALGEVSSKLPKGTSGTVLNVLLVIPALLMNVSPTSSTVTPSPCRTMIRLGNASPPWETK